MHMHEGMNMNLKNKFKNFFFPETILVVLLLWPMLLSICLYKWYVDMKGSCYLTAYIGTRKLDNPVPFG